MIQMVGVQKHFGALHVLKDIDLSVQTGEKLVVIGPSGSGKSTLIRCMNLLEQPTEGKSSSMVWK
jgi:putative glutamine transport system ATP-binding protein